MRIATTQIYLQSIESFGRQQTKLAELQEQISTGVRINNPSDDPIASARVLDLQQIVSIHEQYNDNITLAQNRLNYEETVLAGMETVYFRIKELAIQGSGIANDQVSLDAIASEIQERYEELLSLSNSQDSSGDYLFAGFQNQSQPFVEQQTGSVSHVTYAGDQGQRSFQISPTRQIVADDSGSRILLEVSSNIGLNEAADLANVGTGVIAPADVYDQSGFVSGNYEIVFTAANTYDVVDLSGPTTIVTGATYSDGNPIEFNGIRTSITGAPAVGDSFTVSPGQYRDVFTTLSSMVSKLTDTSLTDSQKLENLQQAQIDLESFFNNVLEVRTSVGGRLNSLETQLYDNEAYILTTQTTISTLRDTDLAEAISQLTLEQTTLDAAQAVFASITSSSLFDYL